jgi:PAS domain S-box-containing protein
MNLRNKLTLVAVGIVIFVMTLSAIVASVLIKRQNQALFENELRQALRIIRYDISLMREKLLRDSRQAATGNDTGTKIKFLAEEKSRAFMTRDTYRDVSRELSDIALTGTIWEIIIYDLEGDLAGFAVTDSGGTVMGYPQRVPETGYQTARLKSGDKLQQAEWSFEPQFADIPMKYKKPVPKQETVQFEKIGAFICLATYVPITALKYSVETDTLKQTQVGFVKAVRKLEADFVRRTATLTGTQINIFGRDGLIAGDIPQYDSYKFEDSPALRENQQELFGDLTLAQESYYQGIILLYEDNECVGAIAALCSKAISRENTRQMIRHLSGVSLVCALFIIPLTALISRGILRPLDALMEGVKRITEGDLEFRINVRSRDELGILARSFAHMRDSIKEKIADLKRLTTIMESTSDLVSMSAPDGRIIYINRSGRKMVGWGEDEDISGKKIPDIHPEWAIELIEKKGIPAAIEKGVWEGETAFFGARGEEIPVSQVIMSHKSSGGEIEYISTIMRDITERLRAEKAESEAKLLEREMELARTIQTGLLPGSVSNIHPDFEIAAIMVPADRVGGDFYDITFDNSNHLWIAVGDVSGHGVTPGLIMMMAQTVHATVTTNLDCDARSVVVKTNEILYMNVHERLGEKHFMTFSALKYLGDGRFQHAGAHLSMIVFRKKTGTCELIRTKGVYLNFKKDISRATKNNEFLLNPGDTLVLYTDGMTEAVHPDGKMLDLDGFVKIVEKHAHQEPEPMKEMIMADVIQWCDDKRSDDITLVIVRRKKQMNGSEKPFVSLRK